MNALIILAALVAVIAADGYYGNGNRLSRFGFGSKGLALGKGNGNGYNNGYGAGFGFGNGVGYEAGYGGVGYAGNRYGLRNKFNNYRGNFYGRYPGESFVDLIKFTTAFLGRNSRLNI